LDSCNRTGCRMDFDSGAKAADPAGAARRRQRETSWFFIVNNVGSNSVLPYGELVAGREIVRETCRTKRKRPRKDRVVLRMGKRREHTRRKTIDPNIQNLTVWCLLVNAHNAQRNAHQATSKEHLAPYQVPGILRALHCSVMKWNRQSVALLALCLSHVIAGRKAQGSEYKVRCVAD
jgi:hypothetical protein